MARFCDYEIIGELGRGGMGAVYRARHKSGRIVALKVMRPEFRTNPSAERRFRRAPQLYPKNPNIVEVYDSGECDGTLYFAMQLIEGESLSAVLRRVRVFTPEQYARVLHDVASALDGSHSKGVIHRDIKPSNILVRTADGKSFLTDFDIAKDLAGPQFTSVSGAGGMMGTAHYMSPEQASGKQITPASDVYSLGAMSYEALAGRPPFQADSEFVVARMHLQDPPQELSKVNPAIPEKVSAVVMKALQKDPRDRYISAGAFALAFNAALKKEKVVAAPLPRWAMLAGGLTALVVFAMLAIAVISGAGAVSDDNGGVTVNKPGVTITRRPSSGTRIVTNAEATAGDGAEVVETATDDMEPGQATVTPDLRVLPSPTYPPPPPTRVPDLPTALPIALPQPATSAPQQPPPQQNPPSQQNPTSPPPAATAVPPAAPTAVVVVTSPPLIIATIYVRPIYIITPLPKTCYLLKIC
ncbi:MAG TPA: serine/threonine-protein kinase [Anaerolineae bacterium]|jgi:serine/threonine-protein kinase